MMPLPLSFWKTKQKDPTLGVDVFNPDPRFDPVCIKVNSNENRSATEVAIKCILLMLAKYPSAPYVKYKTKFSTGVVNWKAIPFMVESVVKFFEDEGFKTTWYVRDGGAPKTWGEHDVMIEVSR